MAKVMSSFLTFSASKLASNVDEGLLPLAALTDDALPGSSPCSPSLSPTAEQQEAQSLNQAKPRKGSGAAHSGPQQHRAASSRPCAAGAVGCAVRDRPDSVWKAMV